MMNSIIVTGSSNGIGACTAKEWCRRGTDNYYFGLSRFSGNDVTNYDQMEQYMKMIDIDTTIRALVNNAGIVKLGTILEMSHEDWVDQFNTNVHGMFNMSKLYANLCISKKIPGKIINIASTAGLGPRPGRAGYSASKAAVINFSLSMAQELKEYGIKVYCVCPGAVDTDMRHKINPDDNFDKMMKPLELAKFICDLVDDGMHLDNQVLEVRKNI